MAVPPAVGSASLEQLACNGQRFPVLPVYESRGNTLSNVLVWINEPLRFPKSLFSRLFFSSLHLTCPSQGMEKCYYS